MQPKHCNIVELIIFQYPITYLKRIPMNITYLIFLILGIYFFLSF